MSDSSSMECKIEVLTENDKETVVKLLRSVFFKEEPVSKCLGLGDGLDLTVESEEYALDELNEGISLKLVHNGEIVGLGLNGYLLRGYISEPIKRTNNEQYNKYADLMERVAIESDTFSKFPNSDKALIFKVYFVVEGYKRKGILQELITMSKKIAKEKGCGFISAECTSYYSAKALEKLGFQCCYSLKYADHKVNGETPVLPELPHEELKVFICSVN